MKNRVGYKAFSGVIVVVFVVLIGALGYTYLVNNNSKLAKTDTNKTTAFVVPTITKTSDLDQATEVLDSTTFDEDLTTLEEMENQL